METNNRHTTVMDPHAAPEDRTRFLQGWFDTGMPTEPAPSAAGTLPPCKPIWWIEEADLEWHLEDTFSYADPRSCNSGRRPCYASTRTSTSWARKCRTNRIRSPIGKGARNRDITTPDRPA